MPIAYYVLLAVYLFALHFQREREREREGEEAKVNVRCGLIR
jgi:hypothetical protein